MDEKPDYITREEHLEGLKHTLKISDDLLNLAKRFMEIKDVLIDTGIMKESTKKDKE